MPKVSVIIPCYNHGQYLEESVSSVLNQTFQDFEIIIVNDGSNEEKTIEVLNTFSKPKSIIINTENKGLSEARNTGIKAASGEYILPLDADDKIHTEYLEKAVKILDNNPSTGIVYSDAEFFGAKKGKWDLPEFNLHNFLTSNCLFCSALYRKSDWEKVGGYKKEMDKGYEDWEFWLSLIEMGVEVYKIPEVLFYYRQNSNSMAKNINKNKLDLVKKIICFHPHLYSSNLEHIIGKLNSLVSEHNAKDENLLCLKTKIGKKYRLKVFFEKVR